MYERVVTVPRLLAFFGRHDPLPHPALAAARTELGEHYAAELGEPFTTAGLCFYRDGQGQGSPGTGTPSGGAAARTRWSRSSRWVRPGSWHCGRAAQVPPPSAGRSAMAT